MMLSMISYELFCIKSESSFYCVITRIVNIPNNQKNNNWEKILLVLVKVRYSIISFSGCSNWSVNKRDPVELNNQLKHISSYSHILLFHVENYSCFLASKIDIWYRLNHQFCTIVQHSPTQFPATPSTSFHPDSPSTTQTFFDSPG